MPNEDRSEPSSSEDRRLALFDRGEWIGGRGTWEWSPATKELLWSDNLFRLFGLEPGPLAPSPEAVIAEVHPNDRERVGKVVADMAAGGEVTPVDYRIVRPDGELRHLHATVSLLDDSGGERHLIGSVQDVTSERRGARHLQAHAAVSEVLDRWEAFEPGTEALLSGLAHALDLVFATLWVPGRETLVPRVIWHQPSPALSALAEATRRWRPGRGSPVLGRAWTDRVPIISARPAEGAPPERTMAIRDPGIKALVAVPAVMGTETVAVLGFASSDPIEPTDQLMRALTGIGHEIGYFLAGHRGSLGEPTLTPRGVEILQLAARGRSASEIAEELVLSPATVKRHFEDAYARLGVSDRAAAVAVAMRQGLID
jgi:PAS domain S-box-containing protein